MNIQTFSETIIELHSTEEWGKLTRNTQGLLNQTAEGKKSLVGGKSDLNLKPKQVNHYDTRRRLTRTTMSDSTTALKLGTALVIFCLISDITAFSRQKRGFRQDAATRVAHGFGKRASLLPYNQIENLSSFLEDTSDGSEVSVNKLERLLAKHPSLQRFLMNNYLTPDADDDFSSSEDLYSRVLMK